MNQQSIILFVIRFGLVLAAGLMLLLLGLIGTILFQMPPSVPHS